MLPAACDHGQFLDRVLHALRLVYKSVLAEQPYGAKRFKGCKLWLCTDHGKVCWCMSGRVRAKKTLESVHES